MNRLYKALLAVVAAVLFAAPVYPASQFPPKKNTAFTLNFTLYKNDGTIVANPGTYTKKVSIDGAAVADIAASVVEEDTTYGQCSLVLAAGEMNGDVIWIYITDDTTGTVPYTLTLYTAANLLDDVKTDTAAVKAKTDYLPSATAGSTGGVFIAGTNAATTITSAFTTTFTGNLTGSVGSVTTKTGYELADGAITAAKIATDAISADEIAAGAVTKIQAGLATPTNITAGTITTVTNLTNLPATAALEATLTEMKGATFSGSTDSLEAIRDRGDAAWITGGGGTPLTAQETRDAMKLAPTAGAPAADSVDAHLDTVVAFGAPPSSAAVRAEMDANSTKLANLDTTVSSRSTYAGGAVASVTGAVGSVTGLTASDVGEIKAAVITNATGVDIAADIAALKAETALIVEDTGTTLPAAIADLPTVAEFTARTAPTTAGAGEEFTAAALALAPTGGSAPTAGEIRTEMESGAGALLPLINAKTTNLPASPAAVGSDMGTVTSVTNPVTAGTVSDKTGYALAVTPPTASAIASAVRDVDNTTPAASSLGAAVNSAASAGDPWSTALPGAYAAGSAGATLSAAAKEATVLGNFGVTWGSTYPLTNRTGVINVPRGDVYAITTTLGASFPLTGRTVYFVAQKTKAATNATAIVNRAMTITSIANRTCTITLTAAETATAGAYLYEIELRDTTTEANPSTAEAGTLSIVDDLRK